MKTFWKIIKIVLLVFLGLFILALVGGFIFLKNFDIKKYKPQIISAAQKAVGRPVDFADIDLQVSLQNGIRLNLKNVTIAENPEFSQTNFVQVGTISVGVDILSFINARQISIPNLLVQSPQINVIRNAGGHLNVETLGAPGAATSSSAPGAAPAVSTPVSSSAASASTQPAALPAIFINSLRVENARLNYIDQSVTPPSEMSVSQLNVAVDHFSLTGPFNFSIDAAVLSDQKDFKLNGTAQLNLTANEVRLSNVKLMTDLGLVSLAELRRLPMLKDVPIPQTLQGQYSVTVKECAVSDKGLGKLVLDTRWTQGKIVIAQITPGIALDLSAVELAVNDFALDRPFTVAFQAGYLSEVPNLDFKGTVALDMDRQSAHLTNGSFATDLSLWPLDQLKTAVAPLKDVPLPEKIAGTLQTAINDLAVGPKGLEVLSVDILWKNGEVSLQKAVPGVSLSLSKTNLAVKDFSLNGPFQVSMQTAYMSDEPNISMDGKVAFDQKTQAIALADTSLAVNLSSLPLDKIKASVAALKDVPLPQALEGKLAVVVKKLAAGPQGLASVLADVDLSQARVAMKDAAPGVSFDIGQMDLAVKDFSLTDPFAVNLKLAYLSDVPNISFKGLVAYNMPTQDVRLKDSVVSVDLSKLNFETLKSTVAALKDLPLPQTLAGDLTANIKDLAAGPKGLSAVVLDADWTNGALVMNNVAPGISVDASHIALSLKDVSLGQPFGFHLKAAYLSDQPNIELGGTLAVDPQTQMVHLKDTVFRTDLSTYAMDRLRASVASLKDVPLPQSLKGQFDLTVTEATAGPKGLVSLKSQGAISQGSIRMKELAVPIDAVELKFQADQTNASVDALSMTIGSKGSVKAQATVADYLAKQEFNGQVDIKDLDIAQIVDQKQTPVKVEGLFNANLKAQGRAADLNSIVADGNMGLTQAKLKDINVLKLVLDKISVIPNLADKVRASLSEKYIKKLDNKDTDINKVAATVAVSGGVINVNPIDVEADEFMFNGQCQADFTQKYTLSGAFMIPKELADSMISGASELQYLRDMSGNISFPLHVAGQGAGVPAFTPDVGDLMKNAVINKGKEELGRVLHNVLKGNSETAAPPTEGSGAPQDQGTQQNKKTPEQDVVDSIFGTIFK